MIVFNQSANDSGVFDSSYPSPPSTPTMPVPGSFVVLPTEIFLAGFRDCTAEAIKYLVEVEKVSAQDPLITGLQQYLCDRQQRIDVPQVMQQVAVPEDLPTLPFTMSDVLAHKLVAPSPFLPVYPQHTALTPTPSQPLPIIAAPIAESSPCPSPTSYTDTTCFSCEDIVSSKDMTSSSAKDTIDLDEQAQELSKLAENNPEINLLLGELFDLLDEEEEEDDDEDDSIMSDDDDFGYSSEDMDFV